MADNADTGEGETVYTEKGKAEVGRLKDEVTANGKRRTAEYQHEHEYEHEPHRPGAEVLSPKAAPPMLKKHVFAKRT